MQNQETILNVGQRILNQGDVCSVPHIASIIKIIEATKYASKQYLLMVENREYTVPASNIKTVFEDHPRARFCTVDGYAAYIANNRIPMKLQLHNITV